MLIITVFALIQFNLLGTSQCEEYLDFETLLINNSIASKVSYSDIQEFFGEPIDILTFKDEAGFFDGTEYSIASYDKIRFNIFRDTAYLKDWELTDDDFFQFDNIRLSKRTTLADIEGAYPIAFSNGYAYKPTQSGRHFFLIRISVKPCWSDEWVLHFSNGELIKIQYFMPT